MANLTLMGLYNYDDTLFNQLEVPEGVDKQLLIDNILMECAELEVVYSNYHFIKWAIGRWSEKELVVWNKLKELFELDYNPIWNVDGTEEESITRALDRSTNSTGNINNASSVGVNSTNAHGVTGFNSEDYANAEQDILDSTTGSTSNTDTQDQGNQKDLETITTKKTRGGNIGVTTTQKMLNEELDVRPKLNIYNYIVESFKSRFCLLIY